MQKVLDALKAVWGRLTSSKVAWMALPAGIAQVVLAVSGVDVGPTMEAVFAGCFWRRITRLTKPVFKGKRS
ncbi:MAG: hypothetical protein RSG96_06575, partial [Clostridia bacterium]